MNSIGIALRAYAAGMIHAGAGPDKFSALCEDIVNDRFMACQLADVTCDPNDEKRWKATMRAWEIFGRRGCGITEPVVGTMPAERAAADFLGNFVEGLSA